MTNLEIVNKVLEEIGYVIREKMKDDIFTYSWGKFEKEATLDIDGSRYFKTLYKTLYDMLNIDMELSLESKKQLMIIMIEELTGKKYGHHPKINMFGSRFDRFGDVIDFDSGNWGWSRYNNWDGRVVKTPSDWLPYLHLAKNIFEESA